MTNEHIPNCNINILPRCCNKYVVVFQFSKQYTKPFWCYDYVKSAPQKLLFANFSKLKREGYNFGGRCNASEHIGTLSTYLTLGPFFFEVALIIFFSIYNFPRYSSKFHTLQSWCQRIPQRVLWIFGDQFW